MKRADGATGSPAADLFQGLRSGRREVGIGGALRNHPQGRQPAIIARLADEAWNVPVTRGSKDRINRDPIKLILTRNEGDLPDFAGNT